MKREMEKAMRIKNRLMLILWLAGIGAAVCLFCAIIQQLEQKHPSALIADEPLREDEERYAVVPDRDAKSIFISGKEFSYSHEIKSYLLIGTDGSGSEAAYGEDYQGSMADFLLLLVLDQTEHSYGLLQLDRDTMTDVTLLQKDGTGMASARIQLCTAHWYGGTKEQSCENTVEAVSNLLGGVPIDGYYALNMEMIPVLNHAAGGVEVKIEDDFSKIDAGMEEGKTLKLSDEQAYIFVHDRVGVGNGSNQSRMKRQQQYLKAFISKCMKKWEDSPEFIFHLLQELKADAVTDIRQGELAKIAEETAQAEGRGIFIFQGTLDIGQALGDGINHAEFYADEQSVIEVMTQLYGLE